MTITHFRIVSKGSQKSLGALSRTNGTSWPGLTQLRVQSNDDRQLWTMAYLDDGGEEEMKEGRPCRARFINLFAGCVLGGDCVTLVPELPAESARDNDTVHVFFKIQKADGSVLDVDHGPTKNSAPAIWFESYETDNQLWKLEIVGEKASCVDGQPLGLDAGDRVGEKASCARKFRRYVLDTAQKAWNFIDSMTG
ncbi:MAG: hypothetical protein SGARI_006217 [Bacillariaceae sp.]